MGADDGRGRTRIAQGRSSVHVLRSKLLAILLAAVWLEGAPAGELKTAARQQLDNIREAVRAAHAGGDAAAYLAKSREMREFLHSSPNSVLQVMSAEAFAGDQEAAL